MTIKTSNTLPEKISIHRRKLSSLFSAETDSTPENENEDFSSGYNRRKSNVTAVRSSIIYNQTVLYSSPSSVSSSPYNFMSPYFKSPWIHQPVEPPATGYGVSEMKNGLIGSLFREEGHVYSIATSGGLLYTGSDSKNVRIWKNLEEFSGFKSSSGLLKAIVVYGDKVFTGHQDGKIRVWRYLVEKETHKRVGSLPTTRDLLVKSINPRNYVEVRRHRNVPWVKHYDAVSCLCVDLNLGLLYSGSWDKTLKVWRISDSKCLESIQAHDDALNSVAVASLDGGLVFTGSADGTVKAWRRELLGTSTRHELVETVLRQEHAVTSLAVSQSSGSLYAGSSGGLVYFWEREKHYMSYGGVLRGHKMAVLCLVVAGKLVISGSADNSICVWRRDGGGVHSCAAVLRGHTGPVKCLAAKEAEGDNWWIVYSGSLDKSVKIWRVFDG